MRVGYSANRKDLTKFTGMLANGRDYSAKPGLNQYTSVEPAFRIYGKNQGTRDQYEIQKNKNRLKLQKFTEPLQQ